MFFDITETDIDTIFSYMGGLVGDLLPLLLIVIGISIALFIFRGLTKN